jgi:hypothetical protein
MALRPLSGSIGFQFFRHIYTAISIYFILQEIPHPLLLLLIILLKILSSPFSPLNPTTFKTSPPHPHLFSWRHNPTLSWDLPLLLLLLTDISLHLDLKKDRNFLKQFFIYEAYE